MIGSEVIRGPFVRRGYNRRFQSTIAGDRHPTPAEANRVLSHPGVPSPQTTSAGDVLRAEGRSLPDRGGPRGGPGVGPARGEAPSPRTGIRGVPRGSGLSNRRLAGNPPWRTEASFSDWHDLRAGPAGRMEPPQRPRSSDQRPVASRWAAPGRRLRGGAVGPTPGPRRSARGGRSTSPARHPPSQRARLHRPRGITPSRPPG